MFVIPSTLVTLVIPSMFVIPSNARDLGFGLRHR